MEATLFQNTTGQFIKGLDGEILEVTDLDKALEQSSNMCIMHEECKNEKKNNPQTIYYEDAHAYWSHIHIRLTELKEKS